MGRFDWLHVLHLLLNAPRDRTKSVLSFETVTAPQDVQFAVRFLGGGGVMLASVVEKKKKKSSMSPINKHLFHLNFSERSRKRQRAQSDALGAIGHGDRRLLPGLPLSLASCSNTHYQMIQLSCLNETVGLWLESFQHRLFSSSVKALGKGSRPLNKAKCRRENNKGSILQS